MAIILLSLSVKVCLREKQQILQVSALPAVKNLITIHPSSQQKSWACIHCIHSQLRVSTLKFWIRCKQMIKIFQLIWEYWTTKMAEVITKRAFFENDFSNGRSPSFLILSSCNTLLVLNLVTQGGRCVKNVLKVG